MRVQSQSQIQVRQGNNFWTPYLSVLCVCFNTDLRDKHIKWCDNVAADVFHKLGNDTWDIIIHCLFPFFIDAPNRIRELMDQEKGTLQ